MAVDFFVKKNELGDFTDSKKHNAEILKSGKILLAKPQTFMNKSGIAVKKIMAQNKKADLIVIHDDVDLPLGKIKIIKNRGSAGHKGVESVIKAVGNKNLARIRVGVSPTKKPKAPEKFVIQKFTDEEQKVINKTVKKVAEALELIIEKGTEQAMNEYNR